MTIQILLFDQPRSAGHLLARILSKQSLLRLLTSEGEPSAFSGARSQQVQWLLSYAYAEGMPEATQAAFMNEVQKGIDLWRGALAEVRKEGQVLMLNDHPFNMISADRILQLIKTDSAIEAFASGSMAENITMIPDTLLLEPGTVPILTIRDPRLTVPSTYRTLQAMGLPHGSGRPNFLVSTTPLWNRLLYDFFVAKGVQPVVVDADDVMTSPDFVRHLCSKIELDPDEAQFSWAAASKEVRENLHPMFYASQKSLVDSAGIDPRKAARNRDLDAEEGLWDAEFGEDVALVREMVDLAMPHYRYLYERRLTLQADCNRS